MAIVTDVQRPRSLLPVLEEGMPDARGWMARRLVQAGLWTLLVLAALSLGETDTFQLSQAFIFVIVGFSINMLIGYAGQVSLGHAAFVGVGAFTSALIVKNTAEPSMFWIGIVLSMATGAFAALLLGLVALRLKGLYLALITLAYAEITEFVLFGIPSLTGGGAGVPAPRPPGFAGQRAYALLCLAFVALVFFVDVRFMKSKAGRAVLAIQENEIVASSFGINVVAYKLLAFMISGAMAGMAGALLAHRLEFVSPNDFSFALSLTFVLMVVVGGLRSRGGIFIASMFFALLNYIIETKLTFLSSLGDLPVLKIFFGQTGIVYFGIFLGAALLLMTLTKFPGGIGQQIKPVTEWLNGRPFTFKHHEDSIQAGGSGVRP